MDFLNTCTHTSLDRTQSDPLQLQDCLGSAIFILSSHIPGKIPVTLEEK